MQLCAARSPAILPTHERRRFRSPACFGYEAFPIRRSNALGPLTGAAAPRDAVMHCIALCWSASLYGWVGDWATVEQMASRLAAHAGIHGWRPIRPSPLAFERKP